MYLRLMLIGILLVGTAASAQVTQTGDIAAHIDSIIAVSPSDDPGDLDAYVEPTTTQQQTWRQIIQEMLEADYVSAHTLAGTLDYEVVEFSDTSTGTPQTLYMLQRTPTATGSHWGTFVFNPEPRRSSLTIFAPHPLQNRNTGNQGIRVFLTADAWVFAVGGTHKCNASGYTSCDGSSTSCSETSEPYRICDQAHVQSGTFEIAAEELLSAKPSMIMIQPHGYTKGMHSPEDPDIIMSGGNEMTPSVDYLTPLRDNLLNQDGNLTFIIAHVDTSYNFFLGQTNIQGRLLNNAADPCEDVSSMNTGRFVHLEQGYTGLRDTEANWQKLANAVALTFAPDEEIATAQSGPWMDAGTWVGGEIPTANDDVLISAGHTISVDNNSPACHSVTFGDTAAHIDMNANSMLTVYGNFTLFSEEHNVFSAGWSGTDAYVKLAGGEPAVLSGWSTSGGSTSFRDLIIEKDSGVVVMTAGADERFAVQNSLEIISGTFQLSAGDDFEERWASSGNLTGNANLAITVHADGEFILEDGDGTHWVRSQTGSTPIGKMTLHGNATFADASSSDISLDGIDVKAGGTLTLGLGLGSSTYGPEFNVDTIAVDSGGNIYCETTSDIWFTDSSAVLLSDGATYRTVSSSTIFPPVFVNDGKVRYQRKPSSASDQTVADMDYTDVEFSFNDAEHTKQWELTDDRIVADSFTVNNSADVVVTASVPATLTVNQTMRLTSGTLDNSDGNVTIEMADGALISRATGTISDAPSLAGVIDVRYSSSTTSVTTGPEMPSSSTGLRDLTVYSSGQTVTSDKDITVNGALTLSVGTFDNDGEEDDYTMTMADGSSIRRATAELTAAPAFDGTVNLEYISTVSAVTTGLEMPSGTAVLNDLTITGDEGVTLGQDITVNGTLTVDGSYLYTDTYDVTLPDDASLVENNGFTVYGTVETTRDADQSVAQDFGGLGLTITADGDAPGATTVIRVTGEPQTVSGNQGIARYMDITPTTNTGLNATMIFAYEDTELGAIQEDSLALYSSTDGGSSWSYRGGVVDTDANTVTLSGVNSFSRWTLAGAAIEGLAITAQSGSWTETTTWVGGEIPDSTDDVLVLSGHTISVDDTLAMCGALEFGGNDANLDMNPHSRLTVYGDITLFSESHNAFAGGWTADSAFIRLAGGALQTLRGWSTSGGSTSFRDLIIEKDSGTVVQTDGNGMRLGVQNSLEIISGSLVLMPDDDLEARWASSGNHTNNQDLTVNIRPLGELILTDDSGTHFIRSGTDSSPIGPMMIEGRVELYDASSYDISIGGITIAAGGELKLGTGLGSSTYGPEFNPGTITIDSGGTMYGITTTDIWFDTTVVVLNRGGIYKTSSSTTVFPPTFVNDGRVRYQRNPSSATSDQEVIDTNYYDIEFSFNGNDTRKLWALTGDRTIADSLEVNNSAEVILSAAAPQTLLVDSTLRLTSGSLDNSDGNVTLQLNDGAAISRATGEISDAPTFLGVVDVRYTSSVASVATGPELPIDPAVLRDLTIYSDSQTVTLSENATVNGELTLSIGTLDNDGVADDKVLTLADGATMRRATGELTVAPVFGSTVDVEYISTVGAVVTGVELPTSTSVIQDLRILGNMGVTLGADVTVNNQLLLSDSILVTDTFTVTLASDATIQEDSIWVVQGRVQTTRDVSQSTMADFGGLGIEITAGGAAPGSTTVLRVTGDPQTAGGNPGVSRYFDLSPAVGSGLDATVVFHYSDRELNGVAETDLLAYQSLDGGTVWTSVGGTVDTTANTVTISALSELGRLTLGGPSTGCCIGLRGNVDKSADEVPGLGDLTVLIDHLFVSFDDLPCWEEANVDGSSPEGNQSISLGDLTVLIDILFVSFNDPIPCP